jgi:pyroglutamyl-peptidase
MSKILVTGFEPFFDEKINPSALLLEALSGDARLECQLLPVAFQRARQKVNGLIQLHRPTAVLLLGQAGGRKNVCLEKIALNFEHTNRADEDGDLPKERLIDERGPLARMTTLPLSQWLGEVGDLPIEISFSAGVYVCNSIFYSALSSHAQSLFVHVPFLPEQVLDKPNVPSLELGKSFECVQWIIEKLCLDAKALN